MENVKLVMAKSTKFGAGRQIIVVGDPVEVARIFLLYRAHAKSMEVPWNVSGTPDAQASFMAELSLGGIDTSKIEVLQPPAAEPTASAVPAEPELAPA